MTTRVALLTRVRTELQETTAGFWSDTEINKWLGEAHAELVAATHEDATASITLANGTESYSLPTDCYLIRRVEIQTTPGSLTNWMLVQPLSIDLRMPGDPLNTTTLTSTPTGWFVDVGKIYFSPVPDKAYGGTIWYYKNATAFTGDTDSPSYPQGSVPERVDKYLEDYAVAQALTKRQDSAFTVYANRSNATLAALTRDAEDRMNANAQVVVNDWIWEG